MGGFVSRRFRGLAPAGRAGGQAPAGPVRRARVPGPERRADSPVDLADWRLKVEGLVARPQEWTWKRGPGAARLQLRGRHPLRDPLSKLGTQLGGVSVDTLLEAAEPLPDGHATWSPSATAATPPTCRLTTSPAARRGSWEHVEGAAAAGRARRAGPAARAPPVLLEERQVGARPRASLDHDEPGFWESLGYHNHGDPWREQRYWGD